MNPSATFVIAEAGVNHNGDPDLALQLVDVAAEAGADAVKFQTFNAANLVSARARKADYQIQNTGDDGRQLEMLRALELSAGMHHRLAERCRTRGIAFMSTAFDAQSLELLSGFAMPAIKIPSGDVTAAPLVLAAARLQRPLILSTGMCTLADVEAALGVIAHGLLDPQATPSRQAFADAYQSSQGRAALREQVSLLHCVTEYPAPFAEVNLRAMDTLRDAFGLRVGYSDHTQGTAVALAAVARGASIIEKHFTLDRNLPGPDHAASLEPAELRNLIQDIRAIELALGSAHKGPSPAELRNLPIARRSLVAARPIAKGQRIVAEDLALKRPGDGLSPQHYWELLGRTALRDYDTDEALEW